MYTALEIAKWFIFKNKTESKLNSTDDEPYEGVSNLKLQKLLYYAQGIYLSLNNELLFDEPIEAWKHGPVVPSVYQEYKSFRGNDINIDFDDEAEDIINRIGNDQKAYESLVLTYDNFAIYTAWQLRNMTHSDGSPWSMAFNPCEEHNIIEPQVIKEYFLKNVFEN